MTMHEILDDVREGVASVVHGFVAGSTDVDEISDAGRSSQPMPVRRKRDTGFAILD